MKVKDEDHYRRPTVNHQYIISPQLVMAVWASIALPTKVVSFVFPPFLSEGKGALLTYGFVSHLIFIFANAGESPLLSNLSPNHLACFEARIRESQRVGAADGDGKVLCPVVWDGVTCWPATPPDTTTFLPCMATLNGVSYDTASEYCVFPTSTIKLTL